MPRAAESARPGPRRGPVQTSRARRFADRAARWLVTAGGLAIIASILGILVFIVVEVAPLGRAATVAPLAEAAAPGVPLAVLADEYRSHAALLTGDGTLRVVRFADGQTLVQRALVTAPLTAAAVTAGRPALAAADVEGRVTVQPLDWEVTFDAETRRQVVPAFGPALVTELDPARRPLRAFAAALGESGSLTVAAQLADGRLAVVRRERSENPMTGEIEETASHQALPAPLAVGPLVLDQAGRNLFGGTANGGLVWWRLGDGEAQPPEVLGAGAAAITALTLLVGDRSLVVGQADGHLSLWFPVRQSDESFRLERIRDFPARDRAISLLAASPRDRTFLAADRDGGLGLYAATAGQVLWRGSAPIAAVSAASLTPKADGALLAGGGAVAALAIESAHPGVTLETLFRPVWYEGYERPELAWQSTGGSDEFEPKLSLTPLLVGTLKGTFYSLVLAIPLGVLGAMYASQFMHPRLLRLIKPTVEIMAALPSVVLGFLAGLWLAPRVERAFPALLLLLALLPAAVVTAGWLWRRVPVALRTRWPSGSELLLYVLAVLAAFAASFALATPFARLAFGGDFQAWLMATSGLAYDQRNAIVVGLAMGFAVIPIIFAIAEDAFSNVPRTLVSGSLALGATRWQTVTRVVLPTASPGIFSGVMIGFGRAVGETMIVLMATGNTPIMSWSPFDGFRTLSANIAVEIAEAPQGSTLYRTLFLAALLLFVITFAVNTLAEIVRQRLRRKFAQL